MDRRPLFKSFGVLVIIAVTIISIAAALLFTSPNKAPVSEGEAVSAYVVTPPPRQTPPPPVGTYQPPIITPEPTFVYPTAPPLPPPPTAIILTPGATVAATAPIPTAAPAPSITASAGKEGGDNLPNIAWGQETSDGAVNLWTGTYSDLPAPNIENAQALVKWPPAPNLDWGLAATLEMDGMAFSPDGQYLAVLLLQHREGEGFTPWWLYAIDLNTGSVQHMPDYSDNYQLYEQYYAQPAETILGWIDNNRVAVHKSGAPSRVSIATKDGISYSEVPFGTQYSHVADSALSPDRQTLFSFVVGEDGSWLYGIDGSNPRQLLGREAGTGFYPIWSPDGKYVSFAAPGRRVENGTEYPDYNKSGIWLLNLDKVAQQLVTGNDTWNSTPAWSLDGAKLAFLRSDAPVANESASFNHPENINTNLHVFDIEGLDISKLTSLTDVKNSALQWTSGGNILVSSTAAGSSGTRGIVAVSSLTGNDVTLVSSEADQQLEHPILFVGEELPGMPRTGERVVKP